MAENCRHGMNPAWCSLCNAPAPKQRAPKHRTSSTIHGVRAVTKDEPINRGYVLIRTHRGREDTTFRNLDDKTTMVHIDGLPLLWAIEKILDLAPNLEAIRVIPPFRRKLSPIHLNLLQNRGISLITGHHRPDLVWDEGEIRSAFYSKHQRFLKELQGEQKKLWEELLIFDFEESRITSRYFCLNGEEYIPGGQLVEMFGYDREGGDSSISRAVNAILHYLDPSFEVGKDTALRTLAILGRVRRLRERVQESQNLDEMRKHLLRKLGLERLPDRLYPYRYLAFEAVMSSPVVEVEKLHRLKPRAYKVLALHFGMMDGRCYTFQEISDQFGFGVTRARIQQLEEVALKFLGISSDESD